MMDVTDLILRDHAWFRDQFVALYDLRAESTDIQAIEAVWAPLAARLDVHAIAEEKIFYPHLLAEGEDPKAETLDAIGDHNDIRDGVHDAARHPVATEEWWAAVGAAREANDEHMAEEEREGIANFRQNASPSLREELGRELADYLNAHPTTEGVDTGDKDPEQYVNQIEDGLHPDDDTSTDGAADSSLGLGDLRGR